MTGSETGPNADGRSTSGLPAASELGVGLERDALEALETLQTAGRALSPLQVTVEGGSTPVVLAAVATFFAATVLAVLVTYRFVEGYRRTRARPILLLAVGMFLLAPAPMFLRLLAGNVDPVPLSARLLLTTLSELCGLLVILYVVYTR